ncbi:aldo/keto reductase [Pseudooceanicola sp.]|uniref:aldo/keto reductase n=1 Tax=Pseudooceanicola sp. TaxID=1914328 RepID=UPI0035C6D7C7
MKTTRLGHTELQVTTFCLGTMTWGSQTGTRRAHAQLDAARDRGINFLDTAEIYPLDPVRPETIGRTERIIGLWLDGAAARRADMIIATKHAGQGMRMIRGGAPISAATIPEAVEGSLRRMKTDYIDLYQLHWPNRGSYHFRRNWDRQAATLDPHRVTDNMIDCLDALEKERRRGTIRAFGLCNETAWGLARWGTLATARQAPFPATIQNDYSLLHRMFDTDLAEVSLHDGIGLLASAPLAAGLLTGKYQGGAVPKGSRMERIPDLNNRATPRSFAAVEDYMDLAFKHDLDPVHMALAWVASRPFVTSTVFGARTAAQLTRILDGLDLELSEEVLKDIDLVHRDHPQPY